MDRKRLRAAGILAAALPFLLCACSAVGVGTRTTIYDPQQTRPGR